MGKITINKEVILIVLPVLLTSSITLISNWTNFQDKKLEIDFKNQIDFDKFTLINGFENDLIKDESIIAKSIIDRTYVLNRLIKKRNSQNFLEIDSPLIDSLSKDVAKNIGVMDAYEILKIGDSSHVPFIQSYLGSELKILKSLKNGKLDDSLLISNYRINSAMKKNADFLLPHINSKFKKQIIRQEKHQKNMQWLKAVAILNLVGFIICVSLVIYLIYYSISNKTFK